MRTVMRIKNGYGPAAWLLLAGLLLGGCQGRTTSDNDLVLIDYERVRSLQAEAEQGDRETRLLIVDVRRPAQFDEGHIPGAVNIPLGDLRAADPRLHRADRIVVYGESWADARGPAAAKQLIQEGHDNVYDFRGGIELWEARGGEVTP